MTFWAFFDNLATFYRDDPVTLSADNCERERAVHNWTSTKNFKNYRKVSYLSFPSWQKCHKVSSNRPLQTFAKSSLLHFDFRSKMGGKESKQFPLTYDEAVKRGISGSWVGIFVIKWFQRSSWLMSNLKANLKVFLSLFQWPIRNGADCKMRSEDFPHLQGLDMSTETFFSEKF